MKTRAHTIREQIRQAEAELAAIDAERSQLVKDIGTKPEDAAKATASLRDANRKLQEVQANLSGLRESEAVASELDASDQVSTGKTEVREHIEQVRKLMRERRVALGCKLDAAWAEVGAVQAEIDACNAEAWQHVRAVTQRLSARLEASQELQREVATARGAANALLHVVLEHKIGTRTIPCDVLHGLTYSPWMPPVTPETFEAALERSADRIDALLGDVLYKAEQADRSMGGVLYASAPAGGGAIAHAPDYSRPPVA